MYLVTCNHCERDLALIINMFHHIQLGHFHVQRSCSHTFAFAAMTFFLHLSRVIT